MTVTMKKNDRLPALRAELTGADGTALDLTAATVVFRMTPYSGGARKIDDQSATIVDAANGVVSYAWGASDTDTPGLFKGEFVVTIGGLPETVPSSGFVFIEVEAGL